MKKYIKKLLVVFLIAIAGFTIFFGVKSKNKISQEEEIKIKKLDHKFKYLEISRVGKYINPQIRLA